MFKSNLLKAKHWHLILLFYSVPLVYQIVLLSSTISSTIENNKPDLEAILSHLKLSPLIMMLPIWLLMYWFWSVGVGLNNKLSEGLKLQTTKFKVFLIIIVLYFVTMLICIGIFINSLGSDMNFYTYIGNRTRFAILALFFLLNIFIIFCLFFSFYFVAKTLKTVELQKKVNFSDYVGEFLLIWVLFPIGIWFIQPRINKLVKE
jgi:hypothetical protein